MNLLFNLHLEFWLEVARCLFVWRFFFDVEFMCDQKRILFGHFNVHSYRNIFELLQ